MTAEKRMEEIHSLIKENEMLIAEKRKEVHFNIGQFKSWQEVYSFCLKNTSSREEFNSVCGRMRNTWLDYVSSLNK